MGNANATTENNGTCITRVPKKSVAGRRRGRRFAQNDYSFSYILRVLDTIVTSLAHSQDRISNYPYIEESHRRTSMAPLVEAMEWARETRRDFKDLANSPSYRAAAQAADSSSPSSPLPDGRGE